VSLLGTAADSGLVVVAPIRVLDGIGDLLTGEIR
jgi:hypothetical protein